jgi:hypothetical protein
MRPMSPAREGAALFLAAVAALSMSACGGSKTAPKSPDDVPASTTDGGVSPEGGGGEGGAPSVCSGDSLDLTNVLVQSACEVPNPGNDAKQRDVSALLAVTAAPSSPGVAPGGHVDIVVTYTNKSQAPLPLDFTLDPTPRFTVEAYTSTNKRAEMPHTPQPHAKNDGPPSEPTAPGTAQVTVAPGGKATVKIGWDAVKLRWAPELLKGTPPELGFPTAPAGPLPKGKYVLKVITPLTGIFEGSDHEVSTAKTMIVVQ